jgi:replication-associated recombination protein RarA
MAKRDLPPTRRNYSPHECISAVQKAIRRSDPKAAAYWAMELWESGYGAWLWKRLLVITAEDVGLADRYLPATIKALEEMASAERKRGGGGMETVQAAMLLATAQKSRLVCRLTIELASDHAERLEVPDEALDRHTRRGRRMGRGFEHFDQEAQLLVDPDYSATLRGYDSMDQELKAMEQYGNEHRRRSHADDPTLPDNPWSKRRAFGAAAEASDSWLPDVEEEDPQQELPIEEGT